MKNKNNNIENKEQYKYWTKSAYYWLKYDYEINKKFKNITECLFSNINFADTKYILDVGCGTGFTTKYISDKMKCHGNVLGMDLSSPMLNFLNAKYKNIKNISTVHSDAQNYNFKKNSFDIIFSRFGLMFFKNPNLAFKNLYNSLKVNGLICFVCWTDYKYNDFFSLPVESLSLATGLKKKRLNRLPGPFAFNNKDYIYKILLESNFKNIKISTIKTKLLAENIKIDISIFMKIGIAAKLIRDNKLDKTRIKKFKKILNKYLIKKIYKESKSYKAKFFLIRAAK